jgi:hypothetical protein
MLLFLRIVWAVRYGLSDIMLLLMSLAGFKFGGCKSVLYIRFLMDVCVLFSIIATEIFPECIGYLGSYFIKTKWVSKLSCGCRGWSLRWVVKTKMNSILKIYHLMA